MPRFVIDASATLAWLFSEPDALHRLRPLLADAELVAPWLWRLEVANSLLVRERRKLITLAESIRMFSLLDEWDIDIIGEPENRSIAALAQTARPHQLSSYDAVYLDLAVRLGLPLCSLDRNLLNAALAMGVECLPK